jgi:hypothetical protein
MHRWHFDDMKGLLLNAVEGLNTHIRQVAHAPPPAAVRDSGEEAIARWREEHGRAVGLIEEAKKVILARLGPG